MRCLSALGCARMLSQGRREVAVIFLEPLSNNINKDCDKLLEFMAQLFYSNPINPVCGLHKENIKYPTQEQFYQMFMKFHHLEKGYF